MCDQDGKPLILLLSEGQMSNYKGVRQIVQSLLRANYMLSDRGYAMLRVNAAFKPSAEDKPQNQHSIR